MLVKDVIEALSKCDPNATVLGYDSNEESSFVIHTVEIESKDGYHYCKGDHTLEFVDFPDGTVTLSDNQYFSNDDDAGIDEDGEVYVPIKLIQSDYKK